MKALNNVGAPIIENIIENRPYKNFKDFLNKCKLNKSAMISLIKSGAFDNLETEWAKELNIHPRILIMIYYLFLNCDAKKRLTLQNFNGLLQRNLVPSTLDFQKEVFLFNKKLKAEKKGLYYIFNKDTEEFYEKYFDINKLNIINGITCILQKDWDKIYKETMDVAREWLKENQEAILKEFNQILFLEIWNKYAVGSISAWEMESLCFYYHEHELVNVDINKYGISDFFKIPEQPIVDRFFKRNGKEIPIYKIYKIIGTVISKNDTRATVTLLTVNGIVNVKFTKEYYAMAARQISEVQEDGSKKIVEKGWFTRGTKLLVSGFRKEDTFVAKTYSHNNVHQLYKIINVNKDGTIQIQYERHGQENKNGK